MIRSCRRALSFGGILFFGGCSLIQPLKGYPGPERSESEVVEINVDGASSDERTPIEVASVNVDGISLSGPSVGFHQGVRLLPGTHQVDFDWAFADESDSDPGLNLAWKKSGHCSIRFPATAGKRYMLLAVVNNEGSWVSDPRVSVEVRDAASPFSLRGLEAPAPCTYTGRSLGGYFDASGK